MRGRPVPNGIGLLADHLSVQLNQTNHSQTFPISNQGLTMKRQMTATMTSNPLADLIEAAQLFVSRIACGDTHREAELSSGITAEVARTCAHLRRGGLEHIIFVPEASTTAASFGESSRGADVTIVSADIEVSANAPTLPIAVREAALAWCDQYALAFLAES